MSAAPMTFHPVPDLTGAGVSERCLANALVAILLSRGYVVTVDGGGDEPDVTDSDDMEPIVDAIFAVEEAQISAKPRGTDVCQFWALIIPNNGVVEGLIADYNDTQTAEDIIFAANSYALGFGTKGASHA